MEDGIIEALNKKSTSSWNDLEDKPFGEEIGVSDTITWDGVTGENTISVSMGQDVSMLFHHVSDSIPTQDELVGATVTWLEAGTETSAEISADTIMQINDKIYAIGNFVFVATEDNVAIESPFAATLPKKGVYLYAAEQGDALAVITTALTIPNYEFTTTVVKKIDPKYLPDGIGYETVGTTDTLTWDGVMDQTTITVMESEDMSVYLHHVSDATPTLEELIGGSFVLTNGGEGQSVPITADNAKAPIDTTITVMDMMVVVTKEENVSFMGMAVLPKKGVYLAYLKQNIQGLGEQEGYASSLTVPNYEFTVNVVHTLDPKYLPKSIYGTSGKVTLTATNWDADARTYTLNVEGLGSKDAIVLSPVTLTDKSAIESAEIFVSANGQTVTLLAAQIPTADIALNYFIVRGA